MKSNFTKLCVLIGLFSFFISCNLNGTYVNREEHKKEAEKITEQFFDLLKNKKYDETYELFSPKFLEVTNTDQLNTIYNIANEKLGDIENVEVDKWSTNVIKGDNPSSNYFFIYSIKRTKSPTKETIRLEKEGEKILIAFYDIHYDDTVVK